MNYNCAFNAYDNNAQPDPSAPAYVPSAQQQGQPSDYTTGYPYPGWQQQQPYVGLGALDFNIAPPQLAPASVYGYQQQVPGYNGPVYTGSFVDFVPQLPPAPPAQPAPPVYNDPVYPAAPDVVAPQPPLGLPAFLDWDFLQPPVPAYDAPIDPALLDWQEPLQDPAMEPGHEHEHDHYDEHAHAHAHEPEANYEDLEETPVSAAPPFSRTAMRALFYHGIDAHEAKRLRKLVTFERNAAGEVCCPVKACIGTYGRTGEAIRHLVDNSKVCPQCGATLSRKDALTRHQKAGVCQKPKKAKRATGRRRR